MPNLSEKGIGDWLTLKSPSFQDALDRQAARESWNCDEDPAVLREAEDVGSALDAPTDPARLAQQPLTDLIRRGMAYLSPARRLRVLEHLDGLGRLHEVDITLALIDSSVTPAETHEAEEDLLFLRTSLHNLEANRLLQEIFAPDRILRILQAIIAPQGEVFP